MKKNMLLKNINLLALLFTLPAYAIEGETIPVNGTHEYNFNIDTVQIKDNKVGATISSSWNLGGNYSVTEYCTSSIKDARYYSSTSTMQPSSNTDYYVLNDYMDVKVEVWIAGSVNKYVTSPFIDQTNKKTETCKPPSTRFSNVASGGKGKVTFMVTKPIINGVVLSNHELVRVFGRRGTVSAGMLSSEALSTININSGIITVPDKCVINEGTPITVEFGSVSNTSEKLNGTNYTQNIPIRVSCKGGSFDSGALNIKLGIQSAASGTASFNSDYLGTSGQVDRSNLGIVIKDRNGSVVVPNKFYNLPGFSNNQGTWDLTAAPIAKSGSTITEGEFEASASVVAEFQ